MNANFLLGFAPNFRCCWCFWPGDQSCCACAAALCRPVYSNEAMNRVTQVIVVCYLPVHGRQAPCLYWTQSRKRKAIHIQPAQLRVYRNQNSFVGSLQKIMKQHLNHIFAFLFNACQFRRFCYLEKPWRKFLPTRPVKNRIFKEFIRGDVLLLARDLRS